MNRRQERTETPQHIDHLEQLFELRPDPQVVEEARKKKAPPKGEPQEKN